MPPTPAELLAFLCPYVACALVLSAAIELALAELVSVVGLGGICCCWRLDADEVDEVLPSPRAWLSEVGGRKVALRGLEATGRAGNEPVEGGLRWMPNPCMGRAAVAVVLLDCARCRGGGMRFPTEMERAEYESDAEPGLRAGEVVAGLRWWWALALALESEEGGAGETAVDGAECE